MREHPEQVVIAATAIHLPRCIAHTLQHAYKGEIEIHFEGHRA
jgi:hypothetical protein